MTDDEVYQCTLAFLLYLVFKGSPVAWYEGEQKLEELAKDFTSYYTQM